MTQKIDCKAASRLLSDAFEIELQPEDRERLRLHLGICDACRRIEQHMALLHRAMRAIDKEASER